jgi:hypothetical protein
MIAQKGERLREFFHASIVVSMKSPQVAIATENFLIQYYRYVSRQISPIADVRGFILRHSIPANNAYRRGARPASREQSHGC